MTLSTTGLRCVGLFNPTKNGLFNPTLNGPFDPTLTMIPESVRAKECTAYGHSIYKHDPKCKVARAFEELTKEVLAYGC